MRFADKAAEIGSAHLVTTSVPSLPKPPAAVFEEAEEADQTRAEHDRLALDLPAFNALELVPPPAGPAAGTAFRIAAWNAERLKHAEASAALVMAAGADILLLTETDRGMARSGNRHTSADLATALGMGYVFGVEFVELGLGDDRERRWHRGETNRVGFHGNALLSRLPIADAVLIRLDDGAVWWLDALKGQRRLGWRMAIAARIETATGPLLAVVVHLESKSDPADRAAQVARLIAAIERLGEGLPVVIGGDFNTKVLPPGTLAADLDPAAHEPLFALMSAAGFDWRGANTGDASQRRLPDGKPEPPFRRLDWLFTRGLSASEPATVPAVDEKGDAISDHDLIAVEVSLT
ncbi:endonuclease/exonuclease/phosphatase family protein [Mesorhizobium sp. BR1-1-16]|uniref:endonuclease/exonuclease/phosphatase family protein n=1 Tax=Mesorhizobium sp. BR1-1-16 TaxID=2876653 RepID=UPI001CC8F56B|nr:endonuclease/exonuclease/phosphatase family protein [Mesorhizobium sp. BR1-1-16]MBZ9935882.1 endonuclease/exonuclease/phosphatase family protein [Mesorhizobium sp. BR1-1-16]